MSNNIEKFGTDLSDFFRGLLGGPDSTINNSSNSSTPQSNYPGKPPTSPEPSNYKSFTTDFEFDKWPYFPPEFKVWGDINVAPKLIGGHLLVTHIATNTCYMVDPDTGQSTFLFNLKWGPRPFFWKAIADIDGTIYATYSGTVTGYAPQRHRFNYWGAIVRVNHRKERIDILAETEKPETGVVLDPWGIQFIANEKLLITDFQGFLGGGAIYTVDKNTKQIEVIAKDGYLTCPVTSYKDDDGILWVANADMEGDDGEIIKIYPNGTQELFLPKSGERLGAVVGVLPSNKKDELIITRCEWPSRHGNSAIFKLNKQSKAITYIAPPSPDNPKFYNTNGDVAGDILWYGESINKEIIGYDLNKDKIIKTIDFSGVAGKSKGMVDSYDGIESVTVIPHDIKANLS